MIADGDLVVKGVRIGLVREELLRDHRLVILVERNAARIIGVRPLDGAGLDHQRIEASMTVGVLPLADRVAGEARIDLVRETTAIGVDAAKRVEPFEHEIGHAGRNHDLHRLDRHHDPRHAGWNAARGRIGREPAGGLRLGTRLEDGLIFRRQRRLLAGAGRRSRIPSLILAWLYPLALPVRKFALVECPRAVDRQAQHRRQRQGTRQAAVTHGRSPLLDACRWKRAGDKVGFARPAGSSLMIKLHCLLG